MRGYFAFARLTADRPANQAAIATAGGVECVIAAMRAHPGVPGVPKSEVFAFARLATDHPANQVAIAQARWRAAWSA